MSNLQPNEPLVAIEQVERLSPSITSLLGQNPSSFTLQGTNTYLVSAQNSPSTSDSLILIDTSSPPPCPYVSFLIANLPPKSIITDIILTHYHHDHVGGLPGLLESLKERGSGGDYQPPKIWKFMCTSEWGKKQDEKILSSISHLSPGVHYSEYSSSPLVPIHPLSPGLTTFPSLPGLEVIHTPGHTEDSLSFYWEEDGQGRWLWTADTVLGQGTTVFMNLSEYMQSLEKLKKKIDPINGEVKILPGHGPVVSDALPLLKDYISHRTLRETQILKVLSSSTSPMTPSSITTSVYPSDLPEQLVLAATRGVLLHLHKLLRGQLVLRHPKDNPKESIPWSEEAEKGKVISEEGEGINVPEGWEDFWEISEEGRQEAGKRGETGKI